MAEESIETYRFTKVRRQYMVTIAANLIALSQGLVLGWVTPALPILASEQTPLPYGKLTTIEVSWIGSINCMGAFVGSMIFGHLTALLGSKRVVLILAFPLIVYWLLIYFGTSFYHILLARLISGCTAGGVHNVIILFISEIANDEIRGRLGSVAPFFRNIGVLIAFILGPSVKYEVVPIISVVFPIVFIAIFFMIPNTPRYYLNKGKIQKAEKSLKYYKGVKKSNQKGSNAVYRELERLKSITNDQQTDENLRVADFCNRDAMKALGVGLALTAFAQLTGCFAIVNYAVTTFAKAGTTIDANLSSIILALVLTIGSVATTYLADILGRRLLILISLMGSAIGLLTAVIFHHLYVEHYDLSSFAWVPLVSLSFVIFISSAGIIPLSIVCSVENLPTKIRTYGVSIICSAMSFVSFTSVKLYPILLESLELRGCLMIYVVGSVVGFVFVLFVVKETSGQSLDTVGVKEKSKICDDVYDEKSNIV